MEALESNLRHVSSTVVYVQRGRVAADQAAALTAFCRDQLVANADAADEFEHEGESDESDDEVDKAQERLALAVSGGGDDEASVVWSICL